jgi:hypothetical protein
VVNGTADVLGRKDGRKVSAGAAGGRPGDHRTFGPCLVDGNTPPDRIPFDLTHDETTTAHAAEESPG